jgi:hypothetical protein
MTTLFVLGTHVVLIGNKNILFTILPNYQTQTISPGQVVYMNH